MGKVMFSNKTISDKKVIEVLKRIAKTIGTVVITSGDRSTVPKGGSKNSRHLKHMAADFGISGYGLTQWFGFKEIYKKRKEIFMDGGRYEILFHGKHDLCKPHIHIGRFTTGSGLSFKTRGVKKGEKEWKSYPN